MRMKRFAEWTVLGAILLSLGAADALAAPRLELHWDKGSGSSQAVVKNSDDDVLAETPWGGALPRRYSADEEEAEVPILVLGQLRDQLESSAQPEAGDALTFIRDLMDIYADTPVAGMGPLPGVWISYVTISVDEWCGTVVDTAGECTVPGNPMLQNALCTGYACKRTTMSPSE